MGQAMDVGDNWPKSVKMAGAAMLPGLVPQPPRLAKHRGRMLRRSTVDAVDASTYADF